MVGVSFLHTLITQPLDGCLVEFLPNLLHQGQAKIEVRFLCNKCQSKALIMGSDGLVLVYVHPFGARYFQGICRDNCLLSYSPFHTTSDCSLSTALLLPCPEFRASQDSAKLPVSPMPSISTNHRKICLENASAVLECRKGTLWDPDWSNT